MTKMLLLNLIVPLLLITIGSSLAIKLTPILTIQNGQLVGEHIRNDDDALNYYAYRGIPYAKPPLGTLRFEPPIELQENWTHLLHSTHTPSKCLQWSTITHDIKGSEDCLYANIFVPKQQNSSDAHSSLLPVLIFIHGGGLMWGSADFYGEDYLMQNGNIILVTFNYRLGPFGFLSTEDEEIPGNMGFKDQSLALRWIYDNIVHFGGDRNKILLSGWSAGGASVHFHMISEMTDKKWFNNAISFSGTALCPCHSIYEGEALKKTKLMAEYLNCPMNSTQAIKSCLQQHKAEDIIRQISKFYKFYNHPFAIFGPVIERSTKQQNFLIDHPKNLMLLGKCKRKQWLIGRTAEDGAFGTAEFLQKTPDGRELITILNERWLELAPIMLFFNATLTKRESDALALAMRQKYFSNEEIGVSSYKQLEILYNEELSTKHIEATVQLYVNHTENAKAYGYIYDNPAPYGFGQILAKRGDWQFGTLHGDDIFLIFKTAIREKHPFRADEEMISRKLIEMLVTMAETGTPVYDGIKLGPLDAMNYFKFPKITRDGVI